MTLTLAAVSLVPRAGAQQPVDDFPEAKKPAKGKDSAAVLEALKKRQEVLADLVEVYEKWIASGGFPPPYQSWDPFLVARERGLAAKLEVAGGPAQVQAAWKNHLAHLKSMEELKKAKSALGSAHFYEVALARAARLQAESDLLRAEQPPGAKTSPQVVELLKQKLKVLEDAQDAKKALIEAGAKSRLEALWPLQPLVLEEVLLETILAIPANAEVRLKALQPLEATLEQCEKEMSKVDGWGRFRPDLLALKIEINRAKRAAGAKGGPSIEDLLRQRREVLAKAWIQVQGQVKAAPHLFSNLLKAAKELLKADLALTAKPAERLALLEKHLESAKDAEKACKALFDKNVVLIIDYLEAVADRLDAEIWVLRAKSALASPK
jgi:hypothetical protein